MLSIEDVFRSDEQSMIRLVREVRLAGTDNLAHFGNGYTHEGGYSLQQNPDEFAALTWFLLKAAATGWKGMHPFYLEIGSASGGAARFLHERIGFHRVWTIDNHGHWRWPEQQKNFDAMGFIGGVPLVQSWVGDSHSNGAKKWLLSLALITPKVFDIAFVDGDHSYEGCWEDVELVSSIHLEKESERPSYIIFHDTVACDGVKKAWERGAAEGLFVPVAEFIGGERPLGIGVGKLV